MAPTRPHRSGQGHRILITGKEPPVVEVRPDDQVFVVEADRGCGRAEEDSVPDFDAECVLRDRMRAGEGR